MSVITEHLGLICFNRETHDGHDWFDAEQGEWYFCYGGPFSFTQLQIMDQRENALAAHCLKEQNAKDQMAYQVQPVLFDW